MITSKKVTKLLKLSLFYGAIFLVFIAPIVRLLLMSINTPSGWSLANFQSLLIEPRTQDAIKNTLITSLGATGISTFMGSLMALLVAYTNLKRKRLLEMMVLLPFIIPSYIITLSWTDLLTEKGLINRTLGTLGMAPIDMYTLTGITLVMGLCHTPIVYLSVLHMLRKIPLDLEWAARACGFNIFQTLWKIDLPEVLPAILSGAVLAFLSSIDNFAVPAFLGISSGIPVLSTYIYEKAISFGPDSFSTAAALSVILAVIAIAGTLLEVLLLKKRSPLESIKEDYSIRIYLKTSQRKLVEWSLIIGWGIINIIPLLSMIASAFSRNYGLALSKENFDLRNMEFVFTNSGVLSAIKTSVLLASVTCLVCIIIGTIIAYLKVRKNSNVMKIAEKCASLTYAIPGIVLSLAMIFHWTEPLPGFHPSIYGTINILIIAYITRYLILQIKGSTTALLAINPELEEAVRASGGSKLALWLQILSPLLLKGVIASTFLIFVSALTELTLSSMLASANTKTIGLTIFNFQQAGDYNLSAAMSTLVVLLILGSYILLTFKLSLKKENHINEFVSRTRKSTIRPDISA